MSMIDVLVPVLSRPQNAQPLVDSITAVTGEHRVIFICSPRDKPQIAACKATGATTLIVEWNPGPADFAKKINWGFTQSDSEWVFQGADDIRFNEGWDVEAIQTAKAHRRRVVGTNDLHNPSVRRQLSSTHTLFARSYIEEYGGTEDDSGIVFSEAYDHQFVDTEFVEVARRRKEWTFCRRSVVEHLHPHWGFGEMDATYKKAIRATGADLTLFRERMGLNGRNGRESRINQRRFLAEQLRRG